ncbi:hypothetical protein YC2023_118903 [Brassica napus]
MGANQEMPTQQCLVEVSSYNFTIKIQTIAVTKMEPAAQGLQLCQVNLSRRVTCMRKLSAQDVTEPATIQQSNPIIGCVMINKTKPYITSMVVEIG